VLQHALQQCAAWREEGRQVRVSVNVSVSDLLDPSLLDLVQSLLDEYEIGPGMFLLEITETTIIEEFERSKQVVTGLRELGVEVSIDDFGAGVTSLAYLGGLAVAELKLDRRFIAPLDVAHETRDDELVRATIALGHALRVRVVAEGVENPDTIELLDELGCDLVQGDSVNKPVHPALVSFEHTRSRSPGGDPRSRRPPRRASGSSSGHRRALPPRCDRRRRRQSRLPPGGTTQSLRANSSAASGSSSHTRCAPATTIARLSSAHPRATPATRAVGPQPVAAASSDARACTSATVNSPNGL
jgi:EAL domain-containing protein (putative c-di-GMP-specific phosphodiesterase class I)